MSEIQPKNVPTVVTPGVLLRNDPHGYIIEFPRSVFEEHDLTYDDIQIIYKNTKR